jgi:hypothetical protein
MKKCSLPFYVAALITLSGNAAAAYNWGCNAERLKSMIAWCVDAKQQDLSNLQQGGRDNILKGRFCDQPLLITDGTLACWGHDAEAMKDSLVCKPEAHMTAATEMIPESDSRKPDCSAR